ncbi:hypothetical protein KKA14_21310, partial [bacterium]|nr:hypothetical protein [bacterium]
YTLVNTNAGDATLDAVSGTILGAINTFFVQYADLLQADVTADLVTVDASGDAYFTFVSPLSNRFVFSLTNISGDPEDLEIMIYSNNTLSAEIPTSTNRGISSLTMSPLYEIEGEYWIKIKNNSGSSMTFNFSAAVETTDRGLLDELSLYDDFSGVSLNPSLWREISESSFHISGGELVIDLSLPAGHSGEHHSSTMKAKTSDRMGIAADFKILEQGGAIQSAYNGFRYVWFYNDTSGDAIGVFLEQHGGIGGSVFYSIMRCPAPQDDCESDNLELVTNGSLGGSIQKDQTFRLSILWDGNTTFTLSVDSTTDVIDVSADAPFGNANVINNDFVELGPEIKTFDGGGFLKSAIDNVSIHNGSTWEEFDLFTDPVIDSTKWGELGTRAIENGAFRSGVVSGGWGGLSTNPEANLSTIAVDVTVKSQTGYGEAAIVYPAYHDGNGIIMGILSLSDTEATAIVWRCNNPCDNDDSNGPILKKEVLGSVVVGSSHTLALQWDGTVFRFQLDNNESFSISPTALGAPVVTVVSFGVTIQPLTVDYSGTQIDLGQSLSGSIDVVFDNVRAKRATASSFERIEGAWDGGENVGSALSDHSVLVFFPNGIYFQWEDAFDSPDPKAEIGSYTYNNGILNVTGHIQNGRGGFDVTDDSGPWTDPITAPISSDILAFSDWGIQFSKVKNTNNPMVGAWSNRSTPTGRWALEEFTPHFGYGYFMMFYSDGTYFVWADTAYGCAAGEEIGTYSFADGILTIESIIIDNTCKGFNEPKTIPIEFKSYGLELGGYGFNRVK